MSTRNGMRSTGIVRRIDSLGRIVIPKEIRRTMQIREGDTLEIFVSPAGDIILKKYSTIDELGEQAEEYANLLFQGVERPVIIADREKVVAVSNNINKTDVVGKSVTVEYDKLMQKRKTYESTGKNVLYPIQGVSLKGLVCVPIISYGDVIGSVILVDEKGEPPERSQVQMGEFVAKVFGSQTIE